MRTSRAAAGTLAFLIVVPGAVAGAVPAWLTGWRARAAPHGAVRVIGAALVLAGAGALLHAFVAFVREGRGTPAPVAPTERLVVGGLYRYVRNPMYLAVLAVIAGQAAWLWQPVLLAYAAVAGATMAAFVAGHEEPVLRRRFGAAYDAYARAVPAWWPRRTPWTPDAPGARGGAPGR